MRFLRKPPGVKGLSAFGCGNIFFSLISLISLNSDNLCKTLRFSRDSQGKREGNFCLQGIP